jgi:hypothetical protein
MMRLSDNLQTVTTADGGVILDVRKGKMFRLNPVGSKILELLKSGNSLSQIVEEISGDCAVSPVVVREDLQEFLRNLETCGLIDAGDANRDA